MKQKRGEETRPLSRTEPPEVHHWDTADGPLTESGLINKIRGMGFQCTVYTYPPGTTFPEHTHTIDKIDAVFAGRFNINILGTDIVLEAGDWLFVPRDTLHSARVVGNEPVVSVDAVRNRKS